MPEQGGFYNPSDDPIANGLSADRETRRIANRAAAEALKRAKGDSAALARAHDSTLTLTRRGTKRMAARLGMENVIAVLDPEAETTVRDRLDASKLALQVSGDLRPDSTTVQVHVAFRGFAPPKDALKDADVIVKASIPTLPEVESKAT